MWDKQHGVACLFDRDLRLAFGPLIEPDEVHFPGLHPGSIALRFIDHLEAGELDPVLLSVDSLFAEYLRFRKAERLR